MIAQTQHRLFSNFAGVALADILANGVAIIILMIVITVMIKHEQEEERLEQVEDVSILLSRDLASSVVMNALPTSPPARLHHYKADVLDRNPTHTMMPIIELHTNYIRNYYTGEKIMRNNLLMQNNEFDQYLKKLSARQLPNIRIDIYSIRLFYIVMSILKDYGHLPKHWHFLGYPESGHDSLGSDRAINKNENLFKEKETLAQKINPGTGDSKQSEEANGTRGDKNYGIPQETVFDTQAASLENYPYDDLAFQNDSPQKQEAPDDLPGSISAPTNEKSQISDNFFNALAQMMMEDASGKRQQQQTRTSRFRSARAVSENQQQQNKGSSGEQEQPQVNAGTLRLMLPALFEFMRQIQTEADEGGATRLAEYNFKRDILPLLQKMSTNNTNMQQNQLFDRLNNLLSYTPEDTDAPIKISQDTNALLYSNALAVPINQRLSTAVLVGNDAQDKQDELPEEMRPTLHFGLYPAIYRGLRTPLKKDTLVLMPPQQDAPHEFRWRVVTMVSPAVDDFMTAFIYAAFDNKGQLLLAAEENSLNMAGYHVATNYPIMPLRNERWLLLIYGIPALLFTLGVLRRSRKTA